MKLTISIVNYNSREHLVDCISSIYESTDLEIKEIEVLVVNNDRARIEVDEIDQKKEGLNIRVIEVGENVGFGRAHNIGVRESRGEFVLFLNPDARLTKKSIEELLILIENKKNIAIVGPYLTSEKGEFQSSSFGGDLTPTSLILGKILSRDLIEGNNDLEKQNPFTVSWVSGAAMMVKKDVFNELGGFDSNFFMYFEDVDLCKRVRDCGWEVAVNPKARVIHYSGGSIKQISKKKRYYYNSQKRYFIKHFGYLSFVLIWFLRLPKYLINVYFRK